ncbi:MAG TPA: TetR family transcriptional regulator [Spongiibacteraceae bacterium]|nr:TetR family transcriptional regulator [Spongiibacteraceae bacterium]
MTTHTTPKRRNAQKTKANILIAAQKAFSNQGYAHASIRDIAALAEVNSALLLRYFGSKSGLFEAALIDAMRMDDLLQNGKEGFGEHLAKLFLNTELEITPPALIALATNDPEAREITTRVIEEHVLPPVIKWLGAPDARARAIQIMLLSTAFVQYTRQLPKLFASRGASKKLANWFAQSIQAIVEQS